MSQQQLLQKGQKESDSIFISESNKRFMLGDNGEHGFGITKFNATYEDAISRIKDEHSFYVHGKFVRFSKNSLGVLENKTKLRWILAWLVTSKRFEQFIILVIMVNSVFLGIKDYTDVLNVTPINQFVEASEPYFMYIFLAECVVKILAMGWILGKNSYLDDAFNWLDFIVVVSSLLN